MNSKHASKFQELHAKDGETILCYGEGYIGNAMGKGDKTQHYGALIVTESRVAFYRKGFLGEVLETMPLKSITSIERKSTLGFRSIKLHTSHDSLEFKLFDKNTEKRLVDQIEEGRSSPSEGLKDAPVDGMEQLKKLGELKDAGILTEDEFNQKKKKILDEI